MMPGEDYYQLLKIEKSATLDEIKKAYRTLALQYHPDINPEEEAEERIKILNQAYSVFTETGSGELMAEDLRLAQNHLGEITGEFTSEDLLGAIFSRFCVGK